MRLGMNYSFYKNNPEKWMEKLKALNVKSAVFPGSYKTNFRTIDRFREIAEENDVVIAEVGAWCNPMNPDPKARKAAVKYCVEQLKLADYLGASCCVNISGANGSDWAGFYPGNYDPDFYQRVVETTREIIETANPKNTKYAIEPMQWMVPTGPDEYLKFIEDVGSDKLAVHLDIANWMNSIDRFVNQRAFMDEVFRKLHGRIVSCHFKDVIVKPKLTYLQFQEVPVGRGQLDVDYYVEKINEEDPELPLLIEHLPNYFAYMTSMKQVMRRYFPPVQQERLSFYDMPSITDKCEDEEAAGSIDDELDIPSYLRNTGKEETEIPPLQSFEEPEENGEDVKEELNEE